MLNNLLMSTLGTASFTFVMGVLVVFFGICVIILFVTLSGYLFNRQTKKPKQEPVKEVIPTVNEDDIDEKVKVAIIAAISAYYFNNNESKKCDFVVKKIKRL